MTFTAYLSPKFGSHHKNRRSRRIVVKGNSTIEAYNEVKRIAGVDWDISMFWINWP